MPVKLALQIGLGIVIGIFGCWMMGIFFTAAVISALPAPKVNMLPTRPIVHQLPSVAPRPIVPAANVRIVANELREANGERSTVLTRPEYTCIRDKSQKPLVAAHNAPVTPAMKSFDLSDRVVLMKTSRSIQGVRPASSAACGGHG